MPRVTVLMSVFNSAQFLRESVESIQKQTWTDFEFVIIDDGSTDGSGVILKEIQDERFRIQRNQTNRGLTCSLRSGCAFARGEFIARLDADDVALPTRLQTQVEYLVRHPDVGLLGTAYVEVDEQGREVRVVRFPASDIDIRWKAFLQNPIAHPTVMLRREVLTRHALSYDEAFQTTQDYDLWSRMLTFTKAANLDEPLVRYRLSAGITSNRREEQLRNHDRIAARTICENLSGIRVTTEEVSQLRSMFGGPCDYVQGTPRDKISLGRLYLNMLQKFTRRHWPSPEVENLRRRETQQIASYLEPLSPQARRLWLALRLAMVNPFLRRFFRGVLIETVGYWRLRQRFMNLPVRK